MGSTKLKAAGTDTVEGPEAAIFPGTQRATNVTSAEKLDISGGIVKQKSNSDSLPLNMPVIIR
jgi:hypothetical protein